MITPLPAEIAGPGAGMNRRDEQPARTTPGGHESVGGERWPGGREEVACTP